MLRLFMLMLLIAAVGAPIWLVMNAEQPKALQSNHLDIGILGNKAAPPTSNPISVYSQASHANPAPNLNVVPGTASGSSRPATIPNIVDNRSLQFTAPAVQKTEGTMAPNLASNAAGNAIQPPVSIGGAPVISGDAFQAMGGQTLVFPGTASGPDLSATPMQFVPTVDLADVFRFDVSPGWVRNRWEYVSTSPGDVGLQGLRVGLVTGTNVSDLAGSLTYFFDANQNCQRITFRGWSGDSTKLVSLLSQKYGFQTQPSRIAGLFLAQRRKTPTGALLMKHPAVISAQNRARHLGMELEMNNPEGQSSLSNRFISMVEAAK